MVNDYIRNVCSSDFTTKDFRTWTGTVNAIAVFREFGCCETEAEAKKKMVEALDIVARRLGNTRAVCRKYYVHPLILEMYCDRRLDNFLTTPVEPFHEKFSEEESILMKILQSL
jgi:DNA topoisomerase-1